LEDPVALVGEIDHPRRHPAPLERREQLKGRKGVREKRCGRKGVRCYEGVTQGGPLVVSSIKDNIPTLERRFCHDRDPGRGAGVRNRFPSLKSENGS
jgi:hypothetical protein